MAWSKTQTIIFCLSRLIFIQVHILILSTCSILQHLIIFKFTKITIKYRKMVQRTYLVKTERK